MQDNYSSLAKTATKDQKEHDFGNGENAACDAEDTEMKFLRVMSQHEMEILTTLFPKCAQTLAGVLRNRPQQFEDEL
jgi:putative heme iron utilization protein